MKRTACTVCGSSDPRFVRVQSRSRMPDGREMVGGTFEVIQASIYCANDTWHALCGDMGRCTLPVAHDGPWHDDGRACWPTVEPVDA